MFQKSIQLIVFHQLGYRMEYPRQGNQWEDWEQFKMHAILGVGRQKHQGKRR